jgi:hypothetical protein
VELSLISVRIDHRYVKGVLVKLHRRYLSYRVADIDNTTPTGQFQLLLLQH